MTFTDEEDGTVYNEGIISEWHKLMEDYGSFMKLVRIGDRLELKREGYCHWAIFVGEQFLDVDDQLMILPCIVHRANPTDNPNNFGGGFSSSSRSMSKGVYGIGDVCMEPLREVWGSSLLRINNSMDNHSQAYPSKTVVSRVMNVVTGADRRAFTPYNVVTNNCEHFVSWARNGWAMSHQVKSLASKCVSVGALVAGALLPRPLALAGGLVAVGCSVVGQMRR